MQLTPVSVILVFSQDHEVMTKQKPLCSFYLHGIKFGLLSNLFVEAHAKAVQLNSRGIAVLKWFYVSAFKFGLNLD